MALPESDAECAALPAVQGYPRPGDIVAYKLLEIGASWAPEVNQQVKSFHIFYIHNAYQALQKLVVAVHTELI